ncbi:branched-chain amino acid ABC transporter permease [Paraburkholderia panacisoli]|uniref:Branched-chain amino acid ABC transporter permease n=1 Tax=Paraburkholderia panacisoli TaxID=2603818 RepID=A0A5B0GMV7_9BURK|nr:branched-chain amino acid ABC transporter permease [Paraburkholderia panacisoli]KAA1004071.1 branched-chain amino acid ABC transporter permease [Paraburkholderia panacisoli]
MNISLPVLAGQLLMGIVNGSFYAVLSLGLAVIFGLLGVVNFAHGAFFMLGAVVTYIGMSCFSLGYWAMLVVTPLTVGILAIVVERFLLRRIYKLDHMYGMLLTLGLAMVVEAGFQSAYGSSGLPYDTPAPLDGAANLGFMTLPVYRAWVVVIALSACAATWFLIERTRLGAYLRAGTENPSLVEAFGVNVPRMITFTYAFGAALAAFAGVLAAPVMQVSPLMGQNYIVVVFAIVVIGGMGSIIGAVISGLALGLAESVAKVVYPESSATIVFAIMIAVLLICPAGLFGKQS